MSKKCYRCGQVKELNEFSKDKYRKDGHTHDCRECRRKVYKIWFDANPEKIRAKNLAFKKYRKEYYNNPERKLRYELKRVEKIFGLDAATYHATLLDQDYKCAICKRKETCTRNKNLSIDHCHRTNKIRGFLCSHCNRGIGCFGDDINLLQLAVEYLRKYEN